MWHAQCAYKIDKTISRAYHRNVEIGISHEENKLSHCVEFLWLFLLMISLAICAVNLSFKKKAESKCIFHSIKSLHEILLVILRVV